MLMPLRGACDALEPCPVEATTKYRETFLALIPVGALELFSEASFASRQAIFRDRASPELAPRPAQI
jgi:hypothetical protein